MEDAGVRHSGAQRDEGTRNELRGLVLGGGTAKWLFNGYDMTNGSANIQWIFKENEYFMDIGIEY